MSKHVFLVPIFNLTKKNVWCPWPASNRKRRNVNIYEFIAAVWERAMAPHSSTLAWKILWMEEPGGLQSMGSRRVRLDWATSLSLFTFIHGEGNGSPLQCSCPENPRRIPAWWAAVYGVAQSRTRLKRLSSSSCSLTTAIQLGFENASLIKLASPLDWLAFISLPQNSFQFTREHRGNIAITLLQS